MAAASGCADDTTGGGDGSTTSATGSTSGSGNDDTPDDTAADAEDSTPADSSGGTTGDPSTGSDSDSGSDGGDSTGTTGMTGGGPGGLGELPDPPEQSGVVYVGHFLSTELRWYRTDGEAPSDGGSIDLGQFTHDMALDPVGDRLFVAQDVGDRVAVLSLSRPDGAKGDVVAPTELASIDIATSPRFVRIDPYRNRLYVVADSVRVGTGEALLHIFDVTDSANPVAVTDEPIVIPATTSLDLDVARGVLWLVHITTDMLHGYDLTDDGIAALPGSPIDLQTLYPQENQVAFAARTLTADPWHNRLYAARPQGAFAELIVLEYPAVLNDPGQAYGEVATMRDVVAVPDAFDVDIPIADRPGILDAFTPLPIYNDDLVLMTASAWNGSASTATLIGMGGDPLQLADGCQDHEGFGCFFRGYVNGVAGSHLATDGAACLDLAHGVAVGTNLGTPEDEAGGLLFFEFDAAGGTTPWLPADGDGTPTAAFPIAVACH